MDRKAHTSFNLLMEVEGVDGWWNATLPLERSFPELKTWNSFFDAALVIKLFRVQNLFYK